MNINQLLLVSPFTFLQLPLYISLIHFDSCRASYRAGLLAPPHATGKDKAEKGFIQKRPIHLRAQRCPIAVFSAYKTMLRKK
jgi:hypothetical protein